MNNESMKPQNKIINMGTETRYSEPKIAPIRKREKPTNGIKMTKMTEDAKKLFLMKLFIWSKLCKFPALGKSTAVIEPIKMGRAVAN